METTPGLYRRECLALERQHILSQSLLNFTYEYRPVQPMDSAQLPTLQRTIPLVISILTLLLGIGLLCWMNIMIKTSSLIIRRSILMLVGALFLNVLYVVGSFFDINATSCYSVHVLSSFIIAVIQR
jgi:hypothetical protein